MKKYTFEDREQCEMCGSATAGNKVLGIRLNTSQGMRPRQKTGIGVSVQRCKNCRLIYSNPLPIPEKISDHYSMPPESYWRESYFDINPDYFKKEISTFKKLASFKDGMTALDVGAGIGKCMLALQKAGFDVYGFEPSEPFYTRAINKMGVDPERLKLDTMENISYKDEFFDFITFGAVLEHLYHPADSLERAMKWLKPGGFIHFEVPSSKYLMARIINVYNKLSGTTFTSHLSPMLSPYHLYEFDIKSFQKLGERLKFEVAEYHYKVCEILNFPQFTHGFFKAIMKMTDTGMQLIVWIKKNNNG